jgi:hypothetical protein
MSRRKERAGPPGGGCYCTFKIIMRERENEWAGAEKEGACPRPPPLRTNTAVPPTTRPDIPAGKNSEYSGRPTPTGRHSGAGRRILWELAPGSKRGGRAMGGRGGRGGREGEEEGRGVRRERTRSEKWMEGEEAGKRDGKESEL